MSKGDIKSKVLGVPVVGQALQTLWQGLTLSKQIRLIRQQNTLTRDSLAAKLAQLSEQLEKSTEEFHNDLTNKVVSIDDQLGDIRHRLHNLNSKPQSKSGNKQPPQKSNNELFADDHDLDEFYVKFENRFRGTEEDIKDRLTIYVPILKKLKLDFSKKPVLDIGCGRGELISLLKDHSIRSIGLDINETMVQQCVEKGFEAVQADALEYLRSQGAGSLGAITGFHIVEHIPFNFLLRLFEECHRVLAPGGIVIFETPNPENIHVGSLSFYYDPSHLHPLPPVVLAFAIENRGFDKVDILRLHPKGDGHENDSREDPYLSEIVSRFYTAQDYAVIGHKAG